MHLVGFNIEISYDARPCERQICMIHNYVTCTNTLRYGWDLLVNYSACSYLRYWFGAVSPVCAAIAPKAFQWILFQKHQIYFNPLMHNDSYSGRTAPLTSKRCILYIYSTNTSTEYFKHGIYSPFFSLQNAVCFIILMYLVPVLFTFYIQSVLKFKKIIPAPKG